MGKRLGVTLGTETRLMLGFTEKKSTFQNSPYELTRQIASSDNWGKRNHITAKNNGKFCDKSMADLSNQDLGLSFYENLAKRDTIMPTTSTNHLYYGDNFTILREHIRDESINLIYLDPELEMLRGSKRNLANNV